ncbi:MAG: DUF4468 domain-containing protein [Tannerella sp.]|jgi:hypothetical protein|nr:DUF4468 domain-containing protein [Tannerella sp.]
MNKFILFFALSLASLTITAQEEVEDSVKSTVEYNLTVDDLLEKDGQIFTYDVANGKDELWKNVFNWYSLNKEKYDLSIISENKDIGSIYIQIKKKISAESDAERTGYLEFLYYATLQVDCKDNKYRCKVSARQSQSLLKRGESPKNLSTPTLTALKKQLEDVVEISKKYFDDETRWDFNNSWNSFIKDEYTYDDLKPKNLLKSALIVEKDIINSLNSEMVKKDDW